MLDSPIYIRQCRSDNPKIRLICLPYAGGNAGIFSKWCKDLSEDIELVAIQSPAYIIPKRLSSKPNMADFIDLILDQADSLFDLPYYIFGHSLGSLIAFELLKRIQTSAHPNPQLFMVSACRAPNIRSRSPLMHHLPDHEFINNLRMLKGTPEKILQNEAFIKYLLPLIRLDFALADNYHSEYFTLECPILAFGGTCDRQVKYDEIHSWSKFTNDFQGLEFITGDHFFIDSNYESLISKINALINREKIMKAFH